MSNYTKGYSYSEQIKRRNFFVFLIFIFIIAVVIYHLAYSFLLRTYKIQSNSMYPTIKKGELLAMTPIVNIESDGFRGMVVIKKATYSNDFSVLKKICNKFCGLVTLKYYIPFGNKNIQSTTDGVFRIIGLPGDTVYMKDFIMYVKPENKTHFLTEFELASQNYDIQVEPIPENWNKEFPFSGTIREIKLKNNEYFLLCDNRTASMDSRFFGAVKKENIQGKILYKYWPVKNFKDFTIKK